MARLSWLFIVSVFSLLQGAACWGRTSFDFYKWKRTLDSGTNITQTGVSVDSGPRVFINSFDYTLYSEGLSTSKTIIDFSTNSSVTVVRIRGVCYVLPRQDSLNYTEAVNELQARNGNTISDPLTECFWNATGTRLQYQDRRDLFDSNPVFKKLCRRYTPIFEPVKLDSSFTLGECEKELATVTLDRLHRIVVPRRSYKCFTW